MLNAVLSYVESLCIYGKQPLTTRCSRLLQALHHPFTAPNPDDKDLKTARALAYDMVYNGVEVIAFFNGLPPHDLAGSHLPVEMLSQSSGL